MKLACMLNTVSFICRQITLGGSDRWTKTKGLADMNKIRLNRIFSLDAMAALSAIVLCVILVSDPSLLG